MLDNLMYTVFVDGRATGTQSIAEIRDRART